jgi:hypothetical protein
MRELGFRVEDLGFRVNGLACMVCVEECNRRNES